MDCISFAIYDERMRRQMDCQRLMRQTAVIVVLVQAISLRFMLYCVVN